MSLLDDGIKQLPFYLSRPQPCPYLAGQVEQKIFTRLTGHVADDFLLSSTLNAHGFRRSQNMLYRPACPACMACVPVRIRVDDFVPDRRLRRIARKNADLKTELLMPQDAAGLYPLFARYQQARHAESDMASMPENEFHEMLSDGASHARVLALSGPQGIRAAMLVDVLHHATSAIYSFFEPSEAARSLGSALVLRLVEWCGQQGLPYVYLGYWVKDCRKMSYKSAFPALERLGPQGWQPF